MTVVTGVGGVGSRLAASSTTSLDIGLATSESTSTSVEDTFLGMVEIPRRGWGIVGVGKWDREDERWESSESEGKSWEMHLCFLGVWVDYVEWVVFDESV